MKRNSNVKVIAFKENEMLVTCCAEFVTFQDDVTTQLHQ